MRIAIIGGGISGLTCAWVLSREHDIVLYEKEDWIGGHTHTVDVAIEDRQYAIDTGFIVYNDRTYPNFIKLLEQLGVPGKATEMSFSVCCDRDNIEYASRDLNALFSQRRNLLRPSHYRMLLDILRFNRNSKALLDAPSGLSLADYVRQQGYSEAFLQRYLLPMCAAIWSGSLDAAEAFPADHFVKFFDNHGLLSVSDQPQWYVVKGGSREYVRALQAQLGDKLRNNCPVESVRRSIDRVTVTSADAIEHFDHVIFACHSDQALKLLEDPSEPEQEIIGALNYQTNEVILHTDSRIMPKLERSWASWNYKLVADRSQPATVTYHMNRLQGIDAPVDFCVTLNQSDAIDPSKILGRYEYDHPVYSLESEKARQRRAEIQHQNNTSWCGAYWGNGFHEDGVRSALDVVQHFGASL
ncbi:MAG: FAD-dependent oxidoreductase [Salinisphaeraceae bacterium]|nr:FAD-dependent oxidoreductase [Salinisphaeraceae bacterium]